MEAKLILAVWGLLGVALIILGGVRLHARRRGTDPDQLLRAHPHFVISAVAAWGLLLSLAVLAWAWTGTGGGNGPGWFFLPLVPLFAAGGFLLGLAQAEREYSAKNRKEVSENVQA